MARRGKSRLLALARGHQRCARPTKEARADPFPGTPEAAPAEAPISLDLADALAELTERQRLVLFLRYYGDLDYRQIAETLGLKPGTIAATIHQAQERLRHRLGAVIDG